MKTLNCFIVIEDFPVNSTWLQKLEIYNQQLNKSLKAHFKRHYNQLLLAYLIGANRTAPIGPLTSVMIGSWKILDIRV